MSEEPDPILTADDIFVAENGSPVDIMCHLLDLRRTIASVTTRLAEYVESYQRTMDEQCASDERHCACVPALRAEIARLQGELTEARAENARMQEQLDMLTITANLERMRSLLDAASRPADEEKK